jgi:hypothetical protein
VGWERRLPFPPDLLPCAGRFADVDSSAELSATVVRAVFPYGLSSRIDFIGFGLRGKSASVVVKRYWCA